MAAGHDVCEEWEHSKKEVARVAAVHAAEDIDDLPVGTQLAVAHVAVVKRIHVPVLLVVEARAEEPVSEGESALGYFQVVADRQKIFD